MNDEHWIEHAKELSLKCKDPLVQIGCVIVRDDKIITQGWNRVPTGVIDDDPRYGRPAKYFWVEHAERNAVFQAAREGISLRGATAYVSCSVASICTQCVRALIEAGVAKFVGTTYELRSVGRGNRTHQTVNKKMMEESGIETLTIYHV